ncbi:protein yippee-like [Quercus suber]|uniref:Protein yippee-like n=1 Tax=Quercus suber TaxID=58331 RepID=A0AAW0LID3_QUESU
MVCCGGSRAEDRGGLTVLKGRDGYGILLLGKNGRAFLFSHTMNIMVGRKEDRQLMTGLHTVADVYCLDCREVLGWKYERAYEETQKYKEGKFILEKSKIVKENWDHDDRCIFY